MTFEEWKETRRMNGIYWGDLKAAWDAATIVEREACAEVCAAVRGQDARGGNDSYFEGRQMGATVCMHGIRRRSFRDDGDVWVKSADREPLSTEEACALLKDALGIDPIIDGNLLKMLRSVEQAHGIGGGLCTLAANPTKS